MPTIRALRSRRVVTPKGVTPATILLRDGVIEDVLPSDWTRAGVPVEDFGDRALLPGVVDTHVHVNEPGRSEWEGFATATEAAAVGGVTTIVDMPLNSRPATTTPAALEIKCRAARGRCHVDVAFWGGVVPGNRIHLAPMIEAGVCGFKAFLVPSGVDDFPASDPDGLRDALAVLGPRGIPLLVHAELDLGAPAPASSPAKYAAFLSSRPKAWENAAVECLIRLSDDLGARIHVVHLSSDEALPLLAAARGRGTAISAETCPHYLTFTAEEIADGRTEFKCAPPIREAGNRENLWAALREGVVSLVVSDHSPCVPALKEGGDFLRAWGGIASLQLALSAVWTEASRRGFGLEAIARWMAAEPARLAGLDHRKGRLAPGFDADVVVFDPEARFVVSPDRIRHRHPLTPYSSRSLQGRVVTTFLRGVEIQTDGRLAGAPRGELLERGSDGLP